MNSTIDVDILRKESNIRHHFLNTDAICTKCGCILNGYYEDKCVICSCGEDNFISGKIVMDIRTLLNIRLNDLRVICVLHDISLGSRSRMVFGIIKKVYPSTSVNEHLIRIMILKNGKMFWYTRDIETSIKRIKR